MACCTSTGKAVGFPVRRMGFKEKWLARTRVLLAACAASAAVAVFLAAFGILFVIALTDPVELKTAHQAGTPSELLD